MSSRTSERLRQQREQQQCQLQQQQQQHQAHIVRIVPRTRGLAEAFRKLVSRCLCVHLPSPEWTVGYYKSPLSPNNKVLVFSSSVISPIKCLIVQEDMSYIETVRGFRKDRERVERVLSSLHLERILQGLHAAATCPGWRTTLCRQRKTSPNTVQRGGMTHALNCWGLLDPCSAGSTICPPCASNMAKERQLGPIGISSEVLVEQKKSVQRFRTRMRVHFCREKQMLRKQQQQQHGSVQSTPSGQPGRNTENMDHEPLPATGETVMADEAENKLRHNDVRIAFEHNGTRYSVLLDRVYQLPPAVFQGAMRVLAGPAVGQTGRSEASSQSPSSISHSKNVQITTIPNSRSPKRQRLEVPDTTQEENVRGSTSPAAQESCASIGQANYPQIQGSLSAPNLYKGRLPVVDDQTMVLQIEQVLGNGRSETRKIYVNAVPTGGILSMFQEGGEPLPRHLQDAIQQILTDVPLTPNEHLQQQQKQRRQQPLHQSGPSPSADDTEATEGALERPSALSSAEVLHSESGVGSTASSGFTDRRSVTDDVENLESGPTAVCVPAVTATYPTNAVIRSMDSCRESTTPRVEVVPPFPIQHGEPPAAAAIEPNVVDLDEGLPSEHAGVPLEAMQLQIDTEEEV